METSTSTSSNNDATAYLFIGLAFGTENLQLQDMLFPIASL